VIYKFLRNYFAEYLSLPELSDFYLSLFSYFFYFSVCFLVSLLSFKVTRCLSKERVDQFSFESAELVNDTFVPIYLAYFFVALSANNFITFLFVFGIVLMFVYRSGGAYFDPIYVLRGYKIYAVTSIGGVKSYIITNRVIRSATDLALDDLRRINDFTFIEVGEGR
jgi:hypothetical protein